MRGNINRKYLKRRKNWFERNYKGLIVILILLVLIIAGIIFFLYFW